MILECQDNTLSSSRKNLLLVTNRGKERQPDEKIRKRSEEQANLQASCTESQKAEWSQAAITLQSSWDPIKERKHKGREVGGLLGKLRFCSKNMLIPAGFAIRRPSPLS